jgi:hypothetical protein
MAYNITDFYNSAVAYDFARQFQFSLIQLGTQNFLQDSQLVYVETASLPGKQINPVTVPYMGLTFNVPGTVSYPGSANYAVTFRCDANYSIRSKLEEAIRIIFDDSNSTGDYNTPGPTSIMTLGLYNKQREIIRYYDMMGVWCQSLQDAAYDIKDTGQVVSINAVISYQYWRSRGTSGEVDALPSTVITRTPPFPTS